MALIALIFLVVLHKLEYFLNSKIIGDRIRNPMWLTLLGLIVGEKLMGIPGMILAPVVLYYIKVEAKRRAIHLAHAPSVTTDSAAPDVPVDEMR
jgi:predicted PurR-regulated permease PerM